jgi:hypothetical protein
MAGEAWKSERRSNMTYKWKDGSRIKADPQKAIAQMQALEQAGNLSAKGLLDANRPEDAPLHNEFEWNDGVAAEKYREQQARHIINSIVMVQEDAQPVRNFFKVSDGNSNYTSLSVIMERQDTREALLRQARRELAAFEMKYKVLEELAGVFNEIHKVEENND